MLRQSFIFLDRFGHKKEKFLWQQGIRDWDDFLHAKRIRGISPLKKMACDRQILSAREALRSSNPKYFTLLPAAEQFRLWDEFHEKVLFLDIETSSYYRDITVIGMFDRDRVMTLVKGYNLDRELFLQTLSRYDILVTFNGRAFDVPVIRQYFSLDIDIPHIDLMTVCRRIGLTGGLKRIEAELGIRREDGVVGVTGEDAVYLWESFRISKDPHYLNKLLRYNEEDVINMVPIAEYAIPLLWEQVTLHA